MFGWRPMVGEVCCSELHLFQFCFKDCCKCQFDSITQWQPLTSKTWPMDAPSVLGQQSPRAYRWLDWIGWRTTFNSHPSTHQDILQALGYSALAVWVRNDYWIKPKNSVSAYYYVGQNQKAQCRNIIMLGQTFSEHFN